MCYRIFCLDRLLGDGFGFALAETLEAAREVAAAMVQAWLEEPAGEPEAEGETLVWRNASDFEVRMSPVSRIQSQVEAAWTTATISQAA